MKICARSTAPIVMRGLFIALTSSAPARKVPTLANPSPDFSGFHGPAVGWVEEAVNEWIIARIKGQPWTPGPMPRWPTIIRKQELLRRVGLSHVRIWQMERDGKFPKRVRLTDRATEAGNAAAD
jgi:predicted DNA-binding transcriptional regulator AlpA